MYNRRKFYAKKNTNLNCFAPLSIICECTCLPPTPCSNKSATELITNELAGNFLISDETSPVCFTNSSKNSSALENRDIWKSDGILPVSGSISIYNNTISTHPIKVLVQGNTTTTLITYPGNTTSYTSKTFHSVSIIDLPHTPHLFIEGKYCFQFTFCKSKCNCT
ncbi:S-Ena type endospore appendage [Bacillus wiedmannii]|uniref:S-Ena type endospore appendage n=1 Tax=Bacillus wiedmannii TaxID=1890302 RepID=UPI00115A860C